LNSTKEPIVLNAFFSTNSTPLIALHGWGMNASVWQPLSAYLPENLEFRCLDLPGHGQTELLDNNEFETAVEWLAAQFEGRCHLLGWSMGGLLAQAFALKYPERVASLSLVASTPCFVQQADWQCGMETAVLAQFAQALKENQNTTIRRFIGLQFMGESATAKLQKVLLQSVLARPASAMALERGIQWLQEADYRQSLSHLPPSHWMFGTLDRLIPPEAGAVVAEQLVAGQVDYFEGCGHAPFMTQPQQFAERLMEFIQAHTS
jgi:pimeloyl-[acyl-carrier protein] methyl ester esterase